MNLFAETKDDVSDEIVNHAMDALFAIADAAATDAEIATLSARLVAPRFASNADLDGRRQSVIFAHGKSILIQQCEVSAEATSRMSWQTRRADNT